MPPPRRDQKPRARPSGYAARELVVECLAAVLDRGRPLDDAFEAAVTLHGEELPPRDRAFARLIVMTVLRRRGELETVLASFFEKPLPANGGRIAPILLSAAAQLLFLDTPPHAAISLAVDQCRETTKTQRFAGLTNAVLRRVATTGKEVLSGVDAVVANIPPRLLERWQDAYGADTARAIAEASLAEAALDLSVKSDAAIWAEKLGGIVLSTSTIRLARAGRVEDLPGYADGAWWVQDAAAALPSRMLGDVRGLDVADLCAAPGGKTAELATAGARVTAVDFSAVRLRRLTENLARLKLEAEVVEADATSWDPGRQFDAVLLDAPCSATGTIRRHPDILHLKRKDDTSERVALQRKLIAQAARLVKPGGLLVYGTCSLEPEEGEKIVDGFLTSAEDMERVPLAPGEAGIDGAWVTAQGDLRTLPFHLPNPDPALAGIDGFFAARLRKRA
jgi:16S rRNA (cytosine967-C5)-methyltransferase